MEIAHVAKSTVHTNRQNVVSFCLAQNSCCTKDIVVGHSTKSTCIVICTCHLAIDTSNSIQGQLIIEAMLPKV